MSEQARVAPVLKELPRRMAPAAGTGASRSSSLRASGICKAVRRSGFSGRRQPAIVGPYETPLGAPVRSVGEVPGEPVPVPQAARKYTMADAPTTTTTNSSTKMAGSSTTNSALPVVVACISRMPTVAR